MLPRQCETQQYADYGYGNYSRHIHRHHIALRAVLCAAIFTKCGCHRPEYDGSRIYCQWQRGLQTMKRCGGNMIVPLLLTWHVSQQEYSSLYLFLTLTVYIKA